MENKKKKALYKKHFFGFVDSLSTKKMIEQRPINVEKTEAKEIEVNTHVNQLAQLLHPKWHKLKVTHIKQTSDCSKKITFEPTTNKAVFFRAGQYISIYVNIDGYEINRPYSLCSSPLDAKQHNKYEIIVKSKPDGLVSNHILNNLKVNDVIKSTDPQGDFYYTFLRDKLHVVAIAGGSGITPFISMAKSIVEGTERFNLTIIYGNKTKKDIIFYNELKELEKQSNNKVKVIHVLSDQKVNQSGFEHGFITKEIIEKYCDIKKTTFYLCGPKPMYKFVVKNLMEMGVEEKSIRCEASNDIGKPTIYNTYQNVGNKKVYKIKVNQKGNSCIINANYDETILVALQRAKITILSNCLSGKCSWCRVKVVKGQVYSPKTFASYRGADNINNIYYTCSSFPVTDLEIEVL